MSDFSSAKFAPFVLRFFHVIQHFHGEGFCGNTLQINTRKLVENVGKDEETNLDI